jgi:hypothetical protein
VTGLEAADRQQHFQNAGRVALLGQYQLRDSGQRDTGRGGVGPAHDRRASEGHHHGHHISGGMLIPGNIPNIIAANKLKISSKAWATVGAPFGLVMMAVYFGILYW